MRVQIGKYIIKNCDERNLVIIEQRPAGGEFRRVVHAHWIEHEADFGESLYCECSSCHNSTGIDCTLFCGACGAIMDEQTIKVKDY